MSMTNLAAADHSADLDQFAARIRDAHNHVQRHATGMLAAAMAAGDALIAARAHVSHGEWRSWLRRYCFLSGRTARIYVQLAEHRAEIEDHFGSTAANSSLRGALRLIAPSCTSSRRCDDREATVDTRTNGGALATVLDGWEAATLAERREFLARIGAAA